jgi:hypothetical protein
MKALTLWEPWASAIALRQKTIETRGWPTKYRGPLAIHAAARHHDDEKGFFEGILSGLHPLQREAWQAHCQCEYDALPFGCIVATCRVFDCVRIQGAADEVPDDERKWGDYRAGRFAWLLTEIAPVAKPVVTTGRQGLWDWDQPSLLKQTVSQLFLL